MADKALNARTLAPTAHRALSLTPLAHATISYYPWASAYFRLRAHGITQDNAKVLADAGYTVTGVAL